MDRKEFLKKVGISTAMSFIDLPTNSISSRSGKQYILASGLEKSFHTLRLPPYPWLAEEQFLEIIKIISNYPNLFDDVAFFSDGFASGIPIDRFKKYMVTLEKRLRLVKNLGLRAGINLFVTLGHRDESLDYSLKGNFVRMTDIDGNVSQGCFCPNGKNYQDYLKEKYTIASKINPDFIWIDDDARMDNHGPVKYACFCDNCIRIFNDETGWSLNRDDLKRLFNEDPIEKKLESRRVWLQHNRDTMKRLLRLIKETVHSVNEKIDIGFMSGDRFYDGYDFDNYLKILNKGKEKKAGTMWRPGGGFYLDEAIGGLTRKSHSIGRQISFLSPDIINIQSEIENLPCQTLGKAKRITVCEVGSHIAAGCTGATYSILPYYKDQMNEFEPLISSLNESKPFFDLMVQTLGRMKRRGINFFCNKNSFITGNVATGSWLDSHPLVDSHEIYEIGLPPSYSYREANVIIFQGDSVLSVSKEEIKEILTQSVFLDWEALKNLNSMGFGDLTGFDLHKTAGGSEVYIERYLNHELNGSFSGYERRGFPMEVAWAFESKNSGAEALTLLSDSMDNELGVTMGIFENEMGGRICVSGHYPFTLLGNQPKNLQIKTVLEWCSKGNLVGYINSLHKIGLWIVEPSPNSLSFAILNNSFDEANNVTVKLKTTKERIEVYDMSCDSTIIHRSSFNKNGYTEFIISNISPWELKIGNTL